MSPMQTHALSVGDRTVALDDQGYLVDPADWDEAVAEAFARDEGIALTDAHWAVIRFMRAYFEERAIAPDVRHAMKHLAAFLGARGEGRNDIFGLFPYGYVKQACRIAGMRKPRAWSTG